MVFKINRFFIIFFISLYSFSCISTLSLKFTKNSKSKQHFEIISVPPTQIIYQLKATKPVISKYDRAYWLNIRKQSSFAKDKIFALLAIGEWDVAIEESRTYLIEHPKDIYALSALSIAYAVKKQYNFAEYYVKLLEKNYGQSALTLNIKALCVLLSPQVDMVKINQAIDLFNQSYNMSNQEIASGLNLAYLYLEIGHTQKAVEVFESLKHRCKNCSLSLIGAGIAYSRLGQINMAKQNFTALLKQDNTNVYALYYLSIIEYSYFKNISQAKEYLHKILTLNIESYADIQRKAQLFLRRIESEKIDSKDIEVLTTKNGDNNNSPDTQYSVIKEAPLPSTNDTLFINFEE